jgi:hypothetical protein
LGVETRVSLTGFLASYLQSLDEVGIIMTLRRIVLNAAFMASFGLSVGNPTLSSDHRYESRSEMSIPAVPALLPSGVHKAPEHILDTETIIDILNEKYTLSSTISQVLDKPFYVKLVYAESSNDPRARSHMDARGLGQFTKPAWDMVDRKHDYYTKAYDPHINIQNTIRYTAFLHNFLEQSHPSWETLEKSDKQDLILAAYNAGHGHLQKKNFDLERMPRETKKYLANNKGDLPLIVKKDLYYKIKEDPSLYKRVVNRINTKLVDIAKYK